MSLASFDERIQSVKSHFVGNDTTKTMSKKEYIARRKSFRHSKVYACGSVGFMANITPKTHVLLEINEIKFQHSINTRLIQHIELKQASVKLQILD